MLLRAVISSVVIVGFVGCGDVDYKNDNLESTIENTQTDERLYSSKTGKQLYNSLCLECHGEKGEKEALGKSQPIGGQESIATLYQLEEYKAGELNQYDKGEIMTEKSKNLTYSDMLLLSKYIESLSETTTNTLRDRETIDRTPPAVVKSDIYTKCKGCHGAKGEVKALGKSKIIKDMKKLEIYNALLGYQNGTYGGEMKGLMKGQVNGMSKTELKNLARYIDKL